MTSGAEAVEHLKNESRHLRGALASELVDESDHFTNDSTTLLKFHGIYQQDDRDVRRERKLQKLDVAYSCMVRASIPGGVLTAAQWNAVDDLASRVGNGSIRITTRQGIQYHFVHKSSLRDLISTLNEHLVTTLAACGDVVRNIMCCPAPLADRDNASYGLTQSQVMDDAHELAHHLRPKTNAYWELWVDGDKAVSAIEQDRTVDEEPFYGETYLPRKFKIGLAWPGDNCIDVYTQDTGMVPAAINGEAGYVVLVGGGLGSSHADETTHPRLADPLGWVRADDLREVVTAIVATQRDFGNRTDRQHARLKYLIEARGIDWFRSEVEQRSGKTLVETPTLPRWEVADDHLGWHAQPDGRWFLGLHVDHGRVHDDETVQMRTALRSAAETFECGFRLTPRQDVLLTDIEEHDRTAVEALLGSYGVPLADEITPLHRHANACPALPTCGLALAESERAMPHLLDVVADALKQSGVEPGDAPHVRMTGCPNGCARPYTAEIGIVGRTKKGYDVWVGGAITGERLGRRIALNTKIDDLPDVLSPLFVRFNAERNESETFGDFCQRVKIADDES